MKKQNDGICGHSSTSLSYVTSFVSKGPTTNNDARGRTFVTSSSARAPTALEITGEPDLENANIRARRAKGPIPPQHSLSRANATSRACQSNRPRRTPRKTRQTPTKMRCRRAAKESKHRQPIRTTPKRAPPRISPSDTKSPYSADASIHLRTSAKLRSMAASNPSPGATLPQLPAAHPAIRSQRGQLFLLLLPFCYAARVAFASRAAAVCPEHPKDAVNRV